MPDFERPLRALELHLCRDEGQRQYLRGKHAGMDSARKQMAWLIAIAAVLFLLATITITQVQAAPPGATSPPAQVSPPDTAPAPAPALNQVPVTQPATPATILSALIPLTALLVCTGILWLLVSILAKYLQRPR